MSLSVVSLDIVRLFKIRDGNKSSEEYGNSVLVQKYAFPDRSLIRVLLDHTRLGMVISQVKTRES